MNCMVCIALCLRFEVFLGGGGAGGILFPHCISMEFVKSLCVVFFQRESLMI